VQAAGRGTADVDEHGHEVAGPFVTGEHAMILAVDAAVDRMHDAVAPAIGRPLEERRRQKPLAGARECHVDRIVHASGENDLQFRAVGPGPKHVRGTGRPAGPADEVVRLFRERPLREIDPPVTACIRSVQVIAAAREGLAVVPDETLVGHAIAIGIGEPEDLGGRGNVERAAVPERALKHHEPVGEDRTAIKDAVAIGILQPQDAVSWSGLLLHEFGIGPARFGDVEPAFLVEGTGHRPVDQRRGRDPFHHESVGHRDRQFAKAERRGHRPAV